MTFESDEEEEILKYSDTQERASIFYPEEENKRLEDSGGDGDDEGDGGENNSMSRKKGSVKQKGSKKGKGKKRGVNVNKGRLSLQIAGYSGKQNLTASEIVAFIPLSKIKVAARRALSLKGIKRKKKAKRKGGKKKKNSN